MPDETRIERIRAGLKTTSASDMGWDSEDVKVLLAELDEAKERIVELEYENSAYRATNPHRGKEVSEQ